MELIIVVVLAGIVGYALSRSRANTWVDNASYDSRSWFQRTFRPGQVTQSFRSWATGPGKRDLPEEFITWLAGLSDKEVADLVKALSDHTRRLGYDLDALIAGDLDDQPELKNPLLETIVTYSDAYRKAQQALQAKDKAGNGS